MSRPTVLLAEDSADVRDAFAELLGEMGFTVDAVSDGVDAVAHAVELRPDAVLVDVGIPGIDGLEVARRIRAALGDGPLLVAVTGLARDEDRRRSIEAGFDAHLAKPIDVDALARVLARIAGG
jgi:CheY-like chemotaxis protein